MINLLEVVETDQIEGNVVGPRILDVARIGVGAVLLPKARSENHQLWPLAALLRKMSLHIV